MKLENFAYSIAQKVLWELEHTHHFKIPPHVQKVILDKIISELSSLIH